MPTPPLYKCSRCKKEFNFENIKYDKHKNLVCVSCLEQLRKATMQVLSHEAPVSNEPINFLCLECKYKFKIKKGSQKSLVCPFCGKTRLMHVKRYKDENDLIEDSTDSKYDL